MFPGPDALPGTLRPLMKTLSHTHVDADPHPATKHPLIDCAVYIDGQRQPGSFSYLEALATVQAANAVPSSDNCGTPAAIDSSAAEPDTRGSRAFAWIGLHEPDELHMQEVADVFGLHPLPVEDAVVAHQRPKLERYDDTLFLILKTVTYVPHESIAKAHEIVETGEIMVLVSPDFVVTVRHGEHGGLIDVRSRLEKNPKRLRLGPFAVLHAIADHVVDCYLAVTEQMEVDVDGAEETAFTPGCKVDIEPIYLLKREVVELRRCVSPLSAPFQRLQYDNKDLICKEVRRYLRDVADHQTEAADRITAYDEMLNTLIQAALARVGMQQNSDMRKISAWAGIVAVPTLVAGVYGMNFKFMPELDEVWGYPAVIGGMVTACSLIYVSFRRQGWL